MECLTCGAVTNNVKFCSRSCSASHNNLGIRRHYNSQAWKSCEFCGTQTKNKVYCSNTCQRAQARKLLVEHAKDSGVVSSLKLWKRHLVSTNNVCAECGLGPTWNGKILVFDLDHIDGNANNNTVDNLRLLCPNCHSQTPTFKAKNKLSVRDRKKYYKPAGQGTNRLL